MSEWGEVLAAADLTPPNASSMQGDAHAELGRWNAYNERGRHPNGIVTLKGGSNLHDPALTAPWAHEEMYHDTSSHLNNRAREYRSALENMANEGPFGTHWDGTPHHQALQDAHNNLRVELQHRGRFAVPTTDQLSPINHPGEAHANGDLVNPRYDVGMQEDHRNPADFLADENAYKVNCQRAVLAAEARHRGHNVEAQPSYQGSGGSSSRGRSDKPLLDHELAGWYPHADGSTPHWQDTDDLFRDIEPSPEHWDRMTKHIEQDWGPGARGMVAPTYNSGRLRHVIGVKVDPHGRAQYYDPQNSKSDATKWRNATSWGYLTDNQLLRDRMRASHPPEQATMSANGLHSPLRFMRTDDKLLHPQTSRFMVDRGTASDKTIYSPEI